MFCFKKVNTQSETNEKTIVEKIRAIFQKITDSRLQRNYEAFIYKGPSMNQLFHDGEIVGAKKVKRFTRYNIGDIIVFKVGDIIVIHKIIGITKDGQYKTQGLNNDQPDPWTIPKKDIIGKLCFSEKKTLRLIELVEQGEMSATEAFGMTVSPDMSSSYIAGEIKKTMQKYYERTISLFDQNDNAEIQLLDDLNYGGSIIDIISKKDEKSSKLLEYVIEELSREDFEDDTDIYLETVKLIESYAKTNGIKLKGVNYYRFTEMIRGALVLDHIMKFGGFDLLTGMLMESSIFRKVKDKTKTYILHHFLLDTVAHIRQQSVATDTIITVHSKTHKKYDNYLTETNHRELIFAWNTLIGIGMQKGYITDKDIINVFDNDNVVDKDGNRIYSTYGMNSNLEDMVDQINVYLIYRLTNRIGEYIESTFPDVYTRWRLNSGTTSSVETKIQDAYDGFGNRYLGYI